MKDIPVGHPTSAIALYLYFGFKTFTATVSLVSICLGYRLFIMGVTGKASLSVESETLKGQLLNAAPGLFFAVGGLAALITIVWKGVDITFNGSGQLYAANESVSHRPKVTGIRDK